MVRQKNVSIPFWVFSLLRQPFVWLMSVPERFNPVLGFLPVATPCPHVAAFSVLRVSIPFWVFSLLRQQPPEAVRHGYPLFQSRSGFSPCCDDVHEWIRTSRLIWFQSRSGFSPCCDHPICASNPIQGTSFQSRSGFSPCCDMHLGRRGIQLGEVSIPFWVFSLLRHPIDDSARSEASTFQSRSGFSPCCDRDFYGDVREELEVSIPFWVFSLLRPLKWSFEVRTPTRSFNPVLGFLPVATRRARHHPRRPRVRFQSRSGFSPCCDPRPNSHFSPSSMFQSRSGFSPCCDDANPFQCPLSGFQGFNPVLGFLPVATCHRDGLKTTITLFQSRSGFSPCCDFSRVEGVGFATGFQSRSGFSPCCDELDHYEFDGVDEFQSRSGFSPCCDCALYARGAVAGRVSIPFWVFSLLRPTALGLSSTSSVMFQSRSGFSPCCDSVVLAPDPQIRTAFQSRSGFSPCCDVIDDRDGRALTSFNPVLGFLPVATRRRRRRRPGRMVSIPFWVFSLLRHVGVVAYYRDLEGVSIPFWVFSLLRQFSNDVGRRTAKRFQSRSGFSPCCDTPTNHRL